LQWRNQRTVGSPADSAHAILEQWRAAGVPYCVLRGDVRAENGGGDKDVDLLIAGPWVSWCRTWLRLRGFVPRPGNSPFKVVMLRYVDGSTLCLDIHWKAVQDGVVYMDEQRMLERRVIADGVNRLSPEDELLHLVFHNFLRKGPLRPPMLDRIRALLATELDWKYLRAHLEDFRLAAAFDAVIAWIRENGDTGGLDAMLLRRRVSVAALAARPGNLPRRIDVWFRRRWLRRRAGGFIALIGPDGAGKSTVVRAVAERARAIPTLKVDTTYLGPWGQMRLALVPALRRAGITPTLQTAKSPTAGASAFRAQARVLAKGAIFYGAIFAELSYRYATTVFPKMWKGHWVVADRYITDLRYLYKERLILNYEPLRRLLCRAFPKPDLLIVLDNRPQIVATRKSGLTTEQIDLLRWSSMKAARPYRHEVLTTDRSPEELADVVLQRMLDLGAGR
jgi:thymidylate kinase